MILLALLGCSLQWSCQLTSTQSTSTADAVADADSAAVEQ